MGHRSPPRRRCPRSCEHGRHLLSGIPPGPERRPVGRGAGHGRWRQDGEHDRKRRFRQYVGIHTQHRQHRGKRVVDGIFGLRELSAGSASSFLQAPLSGRLLGARASGKERGGLTSSTSSRPRRTCRGTRSTSATRATGRGRIRGGSPTPTRSRCGSGLLPAALGPLPAIPAKAAACLEGAPRRRNYQWTSRRDIRKSFIRWQIAPNYPEKSTKNFSETPYFPRIRALAGIAGPLRRPAPETSAPDVPRNASTRRRKLRNGIAGRRFASCVPRRVPGASCTRFPVLEETLSAWLRRTGEAGKAVAGLQRPALCALARRRPTARLVVRKEDRTMEYTDMTPEAVRKYQSPRSDRCPITAGAGPNRAAGRRSVEPCLRPRAPSRPEAAEAATPPSGLAFASGVSALAGGRPRTAHGMMPSAPPPAPGGLAP